MSGLIFALIVIAAFWALAYFAAPLWLWTAAATIGLIADGWLTHVQPTLAWVIFIVLAVPLNLPPLRRMLLTDHLLGWFRRVLPPISETERIAIDAGNTWWDADLFTGRPDWKKLLATPAANLSDEEQAFLDGPVEEFCKSLDDWKITHELFDLTPEAWELIRKHRFFGMIIPKQYGGHGFSALAHSTVVMKIGTRSTSAAVTVMVPNSLGPGELLLHYGTEAQKQHYLPRLARAEEIPCFALTGPYVGSDAGALPDNGGGLGIEANGVGLGVVREHLELDLAVGIVYPHHVHLHPAEVRGQLRAGLHLVQGAESLGRHESFDGLQGRGLAAGELVRQVRTERARLDRIVVGAVRAEHDQDQKDHEEYRDDTGYYPLLHLRPLGGYSADGHPYVE